VSALTLEDIAKAKLPLASHSVPVPEFGQNGDGKPKEAFVAELSMDERDERLDWAGTNTRRKPAKRTMSARPPGLPRPASAIRAGNFLCGDVMAIARTAQSLGKFGNVAARLMAKAMEVNSIDPKTIEEMEKN
jgi:hypothetical protein